MHESGYTQLEAYSCDSSSHVAVAASWDRVINGVCDFVCVWGVSLRVRTAI